MRSLFTGLILLTSFSYAQQVTEFPVNVNSNFRGLSVYADDSFWLCGSKGKVGRYDNGNVSWRSPDSTLDFRSIYAWDSQTAVVANAGSPAYIFRTSDGGLNWSKVYEDKDSLAFIDALSFKENSEHGWALCDPVNGKFVLLKSDDKGKSWIKLQDELLPPAVKGEAAFAASNSALQITSEGTIYICTGGSNARIIYSENNCKTWNSINIPIISGEPSQGIFSMAVHENKIYMGGGDYRNERADSANYSVLDLKTKTAMNVISRPSGYRSSIDVSNKGVIICTGPTGTEVNTGNAFIPTKIGGFNVVVIRGEKAYLAGKNRAVSFLINR
jgi:photosystem II stability/assembly factor-like uncharacterized protein